MVEGETDSKQTVNDSTWTPHVVARALFCGWLPLIVVNALFVSRTALQLDTQQRALLHAYDMGHILGLGVLAWLLAQGLCRLSRRIRVPLIAALTFIVCYALFGGDLENFIERHPDTRVPWRAVFSGAAAVAICASLVLGCWLAPRALRWLGVALGVGAAIGNHLVLQLDYPGAHFAIACCAASLTGASLVHVLAPVRRPRATYALLLACAIASGLSYAVVPGPVVRGALLTSSGAIVAPFVTQLWPPLEPSTAPIIAADQAEWFVPRGNHAPIPAEILPGAAPKPIVILLTVDALRSDVVFGSEYRKSVSNLRVMAKHSLRFSRTWSPAAYTMASLRSLFLGTYHVQHGRRGTKDQHVASLLEAARVHTISLRSINALDSESRITRSFGEERKFDGRVTSETVVDKVLECLDDHRSGPLLIYSHILDPHAPYTLGGKRGSQKQRYVGEVSFVDNAIGRLRREIRKRKLENTTYLIVSADHGEAFGEHGRDFHATTVYEEMIRIPLLLEGPGIKPRHVKRWVSLMDVGPTVLSLFGVDTPGHALGQSLVPFMRGEDPRLTRPLAVDGGRKIRALLIDERWKVIVDLRRGTEELYDLANDPGEKHNLAEQPRARAYFATLYAFFAQLSPRRK